MPGFFDDQSLQMTCPGCGRVFPVAVATIKAETHVTCPGCNQPIELGKAQFLDSLKGAERGVDNLKATLKGIGVKFTEK